MKVNFNLTLLGHVWSISARRKYNTSIDFFSNIHICVLWPFTIGYLYYTNLYNKYLILTYSYYFNGRNFRGKKFSRISRIHSKVAKLNSREIFCNKKFAKLNSREIFLDTKFAKINSSEIPAKGGINPDKRDKIYQRFSILMEV